MYGIIYNIPHISFSFGFHVLFLCAVLLGAWSNLKPIGPICSKNLISTIVLFLQSFSGSRIIQIIES